MKIQHDSGCAMHNMPAYPAGPCDCGAEAKVKAPQIFSPSSLDHPSYIPVDDLGKIDRS